MDSTKLAHGICKNGVASFLTSGLASFFESFPFLRLACNFSNQSACNGVSWLPQCWHLGLPHQSSSLPVREFVRLCGSPLLGGWQSIGLPWRSCVGFFSLFALSLSLFFCLSSFCSFSAPQIVGFYWFSPFKQCSVSCPSIKIALMLSKSGCFTKTRVLKCWRKPAMEHLAYWSRSRVVALTGTLLYTCKKVRSFCQTLACSDVFSLLKWCNPSLAKLAHRPSMVFVSQKVISCRVKYGPTWWFWS